MLKKLQEYKFSSHGHKSRTELLHYCRCVYCGGDFYVLCNILTYQVRFALIRKQPKCYLFFVCLGTNQLNFHDVSYGFLLMSILLLAWAPVSSSKTILDLWLNCTFNHRTGVSQLSPQSLRTRVRMMKYVEFLQNYSAVVFCPRMLIQAMQSQIFLYSLSWKKKKNFAAHSL